MPTLNQSLLGHDLGHLRILAEHWGIDLTAPDFRTALNDLTASLLDVELVSDIVLSLSAESQNALAILQKNDGRLPWLQFTRTFGSLRAVGPGRRDRERPDRKPISSAEELWYRALIARAFFDTPSGAQEFAYIPDDLIPLIPAATAQEGKSNANGELPRLGRAATHEERGHLIPVNDHLLDHICTLLAAHRLQIDPTSQFPDPSETQSFAGINPLITFTTTLLNTAQLIDTNGFPDLDKTRLHLEAPPGKALEQLTQAWLKSTEHNDLHHVSHLVPEGEWRNDPFETRRFLMALLAVIPKDTWWGLSAFLADLRRDFPDFQRPASDYDSWFIRDTRSDKFLRGYEHWGEIDGALIRYLITGPLHWLGILDLAVLNDDICSEGASAFRRSKWANLLLGWSVDEVEPSAQVDFPSEDAPIHVRSDGRINIPFLTQRAARYQIARFCQWESPTSHEYRYRITPGSLEQAIDQGLKIQHLQTLLARHTQNVPPNIVKALSSWQERGTEARLQSVEILRLSSPELLKELRNSRAARFMGEPLGPTTVIIKPGTGEKVLEVLTEMGHLGEILDHM